jgi:L-ascorbate metabolism protein UlaG (beta-lactamase superfamily)
MIRLLLVICAICTVFPAYAQDRRASHCIALAQSIPDATFVHRAKLGAPLPDEYSVRLNYIQHATFLLETHGGLSAATDFTGFLGVPGFVPDVVTMNNAHSSHWTALPDERIPNILRGWGAPGQAADHNLDLGEMFVRNVTTDIRNRFDAGRVEDGNSIFIFEVAGLCIGHLGHLHHEPSDNTYAAIGRRDVVMAPVDGGMTVPRVTLVKMLKRMRSSIVIPMHWFGSGNLQLFLDEMSDEFQINRTGRSFLEVSLRSLPSRPTIVVLEPKYFEDPF